MKVTKAVCVSKYTNFDHKNPSATPAGDFTLLGVNEDGFIPEYFTNDCYIQVGTAEVEITLHSAEEATKNAVSALKRHKTAVLAKAQAEATAIEGQIQNLLAITNG